ncbi:MAG: T9SS type A sorting domain-containing protein [Saprospiraceae bacterium]|jgi:outer membrane protein assembly factor BamB|nr:T9SS type A sorting domain-containing protein [Saprospiraceae bacterium]
MLRTIILSISALILCQNLLSAQYWSKRYDFQQGNENATQIIPMADGLLVHVSGLCDQNKRICGGLIKLDFDGNLMWKSIYLDTLDTNTLGPAAIIGDTIFLNVSYFYVDSLYFSILAYDLQGNYLSRRDYGFPSTKNWARNISANEKRIYVVYQYRDLTTLKYRGRLRAYDRKWAFLWEREFPGAHNNCSISHVTAMPDGGAALAYTGVESFDRRAVVVRYDEDGNVLWTSAFPKAYEADFVRIEPYPDGSLAGIWNIDTFVLGYSFSPQMAFKMDATGQIEWAKFEITKYLQHYYHVFVAKNGDIIISGKDDNSSVALPIGTVMAGYVRRLRPDGELLWERRVMDFSQGDHKNYLYSGAELDNGDLVFAGEIADSLPDDPYPYNVWVVRLDSMGCFAPNCGTEQILTSTQNAPGVQEDEKPFIAFPSPFNAYIIVGSKLGKPLPAGRYQIAVFDLLGKIVMDERQIDPQQVTELDTSAWPSGTYFIQVRLDGAVFQYLKVVKS